MYHIRYADDYLWILNSIQTLYVVHAKTESPTRAEYFRKCALFTEWLFKFLASMLIMASMLFILMPIYMYAVENDRILLMPFYLPGIDENTITGYTMTMAFQTSMLLFGIPGFLAFEFLLEIIILSSFIFGKLIALDTAHMNDDLKSKVIQNATHRLRNILMMRQEMIE